VADIAASTTSPVARQGQGPGEYRIPTKLYALGGDTTVLPDNGGGRWVLLDGTEPVETRTRQDPAVAALTALQTVDGLMGFDKLGRLLAFAEQDPPVAVYEIGITDSSALVLIRLATGEVDTIARLRRSPYRRVYNPTATGGVLTSTQRPAWAAGEGAALCLDGWVAIRRLDPYRVDWYNPTGRWIMGAPIAYERVRASAREKDAYLARLSAYARAGILRWPDEVPPTTNSHPVCDPEGRVLVERNVTTSQAAGKYFDVVDRRGVLVDRLMLRSNERVVGFGPRSVYLAERDTLGVERVRKHPYPKR
jgi:hypothetical protein